MSTELHPIEPLNSRHDRSNFTCGIESLDRYLKQQASQDLRRRVATVYVMVLPDTSSVIGYYTLSAFGVETGLLPETLTRRLPRYPTLPAILLGRLALDERYQGKGLGEFLLMNALRRSLVASQEIAAVLIVVDAINDSARRFYERVGFTRLSDDASRLFLPMADVATLLAEP